MASKSPEDHLFQLPPVLEFFLPVKTMLHIRIYTCAFHPQRNWKFHSYTPLCPTGFTTFRVHCATVYYSHVNSTRPPRNSNASRAIASIRPFTSTVATIFENTGREFHSPDSSCWKWNYQAINIPKWPRICYFIHQHCYFITWSFDLKSSKTRRKGF